MEERLRLVRIEQYGSGSEKLSDEVEQIVACTAEQCVCGKCGKETVVIGYESAEQLDVEAAKYLCG